MKIDAVCRIGGTSETSVRMPRLICKNKNVFYFMNELKNENAMKMKKKLIGDNEEACD